MDLLQIIFYYRMIYNRRTNARLIAYILTIIFLTNTPIVFFSSIIEIEATTNDDDDCDSSYPDVCIASYPPDLNCDDIPNKNFQVLSPYPHGLDREKDGIGCET